MSNFNAPEADDVRVSQAVFGRLPIDRTRKEFRLCRFEKNASEDAANAIVSIEMQVFQMDDCPVYTALSYVWGVETDLEAVCINATDIKVTRNLWRFLFDLRFRQSEKPEFEWFWCDQLNINQTNPAERGHQVNLMGDIYRGAKQVFAYVTPWAPYQWTSSQAPAEVKFLERLAEEPYWQRLWIVQELHLAQQAYLWCYDQILPREELRHSIRRHWSGVWYGHQRNTMAASNTNKLQWKLFDLIMGNLSDQSFYTLLRVYHDSLCKDPRDKIFGIQALLDPRQRLEVNYRATLYDIVFETILQLVKGEHFSNTVAVWQPSQISKLHDKMLAVERALLPGSNDYNITKSIIFAYLVLHDLRMSRMGSVDIIQAVNRSGNYATTAKQKLLHAALVKVTHSFKPTQIETLRFCFDWQEEVVGRMVRTIIGYGFSLFGDVLYHPDEWPLSFGGQTILSKETDLALYEQVADWNF